MKRADPLYFHLSLTCPHYFQELVCAVMKANKGAPNDMVRKLIEQELANV